MKLEISYPEFSLLRELVKAKQMDIWKKEWAPRLKKGITVEGAAKSFQEIMGTGAMHEACQKGEVAVPVSDTDCCALLLRRFDEAEKEIRTKLLLTNFTS